MTVRQMVLVAHRWLGLATAVFVSIAAASGGVLLWLTTPSPVRRVINRTHESLGLGPPGLVIVQSITALSIVVLLSGLILWWKRKILVVRTDAGWRQSLFDLHHLVGAIGFLFMLVLAGTAVSMVAPRPHRGVFAVLENLHEARNYPAAIKLVYLAGTLAFIVQAVSGVVMWWRGSRRG
jgi:uncharacterized iron-regulated membrane protein